MHERNDQADLEEELAQSKSKVSLEPAPDENLEEVARGIFRMTLEDDASWKQHKGLSLKPAPDEKLEEVARGIFRMTLKDETIPIRSDTTQLGEFFKGTDETFARLLIVDHEMHRRAQHMQGLVEGLDVAGMQSQVHEASEEQLQWLQENLDIVTHMNPGGTKPMNYCIQSWRQI
ncbi:hypothetical protein BU15DRAFT_63727 [Melanogaster broomeanus]|nr:hypothetical protein BU15DRAFT_63727 [Melanogaster broomeanus]